MTATVTFEPVFRLTPEIARSLLRIEAAKTAVELAPVTPAVLAHLRESARLASTHYSTAIEGNRLTERDVVDVLHENRRVPGRERDEAEVRGYYAAQAWIEARLATGAPVTLRDIQRLHGCVMAGGRARAKATPWRDGQNAVRDADTGRIVYLPPEAHDVPGLMEALVDWLATSAAALPCPVVAAVLHYQFVTIHPYYDGNGRTARLLTTLVLNLGAYGLKGVYQLDACYARDLAAYYRALTVGPSHNYYLGRAAADITPWLAYFLAGMAEAVEAVRAHTDAAARRAEPDRAGLLRELDPRQRRVLELFLAAAAITSGAVALALGVKDRTARLLCQRWVAAGFLVAVDPSRKGRKYRLAEAYESWVAGQGAEETAK